MCGMRHLFCNSSRIGILSILFLLNLTLYTFHLYAFVETLT